MTLDVSLSLSSSSEMPHMSNSFLRSGSRLFRSNPVLGSQPTCPTCRKLLGVPISALDIFFFLLLFLPLLLSFALLKLLWRLFI